LCKALCDNDLKEEWYIPSCETEMIYMLMTHLSYLKNTSSNVIELYDLKTQTQHNNVSFV